MEEVVRTAFRSTLVQVACALGVAALCLVGAPGRAASADASPAAAPAAVPPTPGGAAPAQAAPASSPAAPANAPAEATPAPEAGAPTPAAAPVPAAKTRTTRRHAAPSKFEVEPATAKLTLSKDTWIYAEPSTKSQKIKHGPGGNFVNVTGSTRHWLRLSLNTGQTGYVEQSAVDMVRPVDKIFELTHNTPVRSAPNRWGKKLAEVHKGHKVHVIGIALNYLKIRMKSGLEGYISAKALE